MKIGVVVPFYNGHRWINRLVDSFNLAAVNVECTLLIIDNSPGNIPIEIPVQKNISVELIREKAGIGYGKANNRGYDVCKERGFDFVIVANQDGYVSDQFISEILAPFHQDDNIMLTVPMLKKYDSDQMEDFFLTYYLSQVPAFVSDLLNGKGKPYYELNLISGACFAFRMKKNRYNFPYLFDPIFHMYFEDEDLCHRIKKMGGKIVLVSSGAVFYHQHANTTDVENQETITADKLVSEKILRLKDDSKSSLKTLYGIFVTTTSSFIYHILRGEFKKAFLSVRSFWIIVFKLPVILRSRRYDVEKFNTGIHGR